MANTKISQLPAATTLTGADLIPVVQGGVTKHVTPDLLPVSTATASALAGKATPADISTAITALVGGASSALDTLAEIDTQLAADEGSAAALAALVASKTDAATANGYTDTVLAAQAPLAASTRHARPPRQVKTFLTTFQPGHGWTVVSGTGTVTDSATNPGLGTSSVQIVTNNAGDNFNRLVYGSPTLSTPVDLTRYDVAMLLKVDDFAPLNYLRLRYGAAGDVTTNYYYADFTNLYTAPGTQDATPGTWQWQQVSTSSAIPVGSPTGMTAINRFAVATADKAAGTANVHVGALALVPKNVGLYPHGAIVIWFDDGYYDAGANGAPILDKYGYSAVQSPIWDQVTPTYGGGLYAGLDTLHTLHDVHGWDIVGHATSLATHTGSNGNGFDDLTVPQLHQEFTTIRKNLIGNGFERGADILAYPLGFHSPQTISVARQYWTWARTITSTQTNLGVESLPPAAPMSIRTNQLDTRPIASFTAMVDNIYTYGGLGIFYTHRVNATPSGTQISTANFQTFIDYIAAKGVPVRTISDVLASLATTELQSINGGTP